MTKKDIVVCIVNRRDRNESTELYQLNLNFVPHPLPSSSSSHYLNQHESTNRKLDLMELPLPPHTQPVSPLMTSKCNSTDGSTAM